MRSHKHGAAGTWRSLGEPTGGRSAGFLLPRSWCRTSSCPEPESGWPRCACSPAQLGQKQCFYVIALISLLISWIDDQPNHGDNYVISKYNINNGFLKRLLLVYLRCLEVISAIIFTQIKCRISAFSELLRCLQWFSTVKHWSDFSEQRGHSIILHLSLWHQPWTWPLSQSKQRVIWVLTAIPVVPGIPGLGGASPLGQHRNRANSQEEQQLNMKSGVHDPSSTCKKTLY